MPYSHPGHTEPGVLVFNLSFYHCRVCLFRDCVHLDRPRPCWDLRSTPPRPKPNQEDTPPRPSAPPSPRSDTHIHEISETIKAAETDTHTHTHTQYLHTLVPRRCNPPACRSTVRQATASGFQRLPLWRSCDRRPHRTAAWRFHRHVQQLYIYIVISYCISLIHWHNNS